MKLRPYQRGAIDALYAAPDYLAQGWSIAALLGPYSVLMSEATR